MKLDESIQIEMLKSLYDVYPDFTVSIISENNTEQEIANLWHLKERGFVNAGLERTLTGAFVFEGAAINAKGIDYLQNLLARAEPYQSEPNANTQSQRKTNRGQQNSAQESKQSHLVEIAKNTIAGIFVLMVAYLIYFHFGIPL